MKTGWRIYTWIIISVIAQLIILTFINSFYLENRGSITIEQGKPVFEEKKVVPKVDEKLKIPEGAASIKVSFDGAYAAYILDDKLEIIDIKKNSVKRTLHSPGEKLSYYRWLPDRNFVIYSFCSSQNGKTGHIQIITCDIESGQETKYPDIKNIEKTSQVTNLELSTATNVVYAFVQSGDKQARIYKFDIMGNIKAVIPSTADTVIKEANNSDKLIYQDARGKLYVRDGIKSVTWSFPYKNKMALLEIDDEDQVFVGELNKDNKVTKINYGKLTVEPDKAWTPVTLKIPADVQDIIITQNGTIYQVVESEKAIYSLPGGKKIPYSGKLIEVMKDFTVTLENNELKLNSIK